MCMDLYVANEKYDGYMRDGCVFREDVNIFDKMAATIRYKNGVQVAYSLTAYSPYEGYRIAFNGTNFPIDDERGIPTAVFQGTLDGFSQQAWEKFQRRMCGTADRLQAFKAHAPARPWTDLRDELAALRDAVNDAGPSTWKWDKAIVGLHDRIFPSTNQLWAWPETACMTVNAAHYDALLLQELINGKGQLWTNI